MDVLVKLMAILKDSTTHYLLSAGLGFAAYSLIWIILSMVFKRVYPSGKPSGINQHTIFISLFGALCVAFGVHVFLDGLVTWYTAPLNPPLEIIR